MFAMWTLAVLQLPPLASTPLWFADLTVMFTAVLVVVNFVVTFLPSRLLRTLLVPERYRQSAALPQQPHPLLQLHHALPVCWGQHRGHPGADHQVSLCLTVGRPWVCSGFEVKCSRSTVFVFVGFCWRGWLWTGLTRGVSSSPSSSWLKILPSSSGAMTLCTVPPRLKSTFLELLTRFCVARVGKLGV